MNRALILCLGLWLLGCSPSKEGGSDQGGGPGASHAVDVRAAILGKARAALKLPEGAGLEDQWRSGQQVLEILEPLISALPVEASAEDLEAWELAAEAAILSRDGRHACLALVCLGESLAPSLRQGLGRMVMPQAVTQLRKDRSAAREERASADAGDASGQRRLGRRFLHGVGVPRLPEKGFRLVERAHASGDPEATGLLGHLLLLGLGAEQNLEEGMKLVRRAVQEDAAQGHYALGIAHRDGLGVPKDRALAKRHLRRGGELGAAAALWKLGLLHLDAKEGESPAPDVALKLLRQAMEKGERRAAIGIAYCQVLGKGVLKSRDEAIATYERAAAWGVPRALTSLGHCHGSWFGEKDPAEARRCYRLAAYAGDTEGMNCAGAKEDAPEETVFWWSRSAQAGDAEGQRLLASLYERGRHLEKDLERAIELYRSSADQGDRKSVRSLARLAHTAGDFEEAAARYAQAGELGDPEAEVLLGSMREKGEGGPVDLAAAAALYRRGWKKDALPAMNALFRLSRDHPEVLVSGKERLELSLAISRVHGPLRNEARIFIGDCLRKGEHTAQDWKQAFQWYQRAQGDPLGRLRLAECHLDGIGTSRDWAKGVELLEAGRKEKHAASTYRLARWYLEGISEDRREALILELLGEAAAGGEPTACAHLGVVHADGLFGVPVNRTRAAECFRQGVAAGGARAHHFLGLLHALGEGVERDEKKALTHFERAAAQADPGAMVALGLRQLLGAGMAPSDRKAVQWFRRAAKGGSPAGMELLGACLEQGVGVAPDREAGRTLRKMAARASGPQPSSNTLFDPMGSKGVLREQAGSPQAKLLAALRTPELRAATAWLDSVNAAKTVERTELVKSIKTVWLSYSGGGPTGWENKADVLDRAVRRRLKVHGVKVGLFSDAFLHVHLKGTGTSQTSRYGRKTTANGLTLEAQLFRRGYVHEGNRWHPVSVALSRAVELRLAETYSEEWLSNAAEWLIHHLLTQKPGDRPGVAKGFRLAPASEAKLLRMDRSFRTAKRTHREMLKGIKRGKVADDHPLAGAPQRVPPRLNTSGNPLKRGRAARLGGFDIAKIKLLQSTFGVSAAQARQVFADCFLAKNIDWRKGPTLVYRTQFSGSVSMGKGFVSLVNGDVEIWHPNVFFLEAGGRFVRTSGVIYSHVTTADVNDMEHRALIRHDAERVALAISGDWLLGPPGKISGWLARRGAALRSRREASARKAREATAARKRRAVIAKGALALLRKRALLEVPEDQARRLSETIAASLDSPALGLESDPAWYQKGAQGPVLCLDHLFHLMVHGRDAEVKKAAKRAFHRINDFDPLLLQAYNLLFNTDRVARHEEAKTRAKLPARFAERILGKRSNEAGALRSEHVIAASRVFGDETLLLRRRRGGITSDQRRSLRDLLRQYQARIDQVRVLSVSYRPLGDPNGKPVQQFFWYRKGDSRLEPLLRELRGLSSVPKLFAIEPREAAPDTLREARRFSKYAR